LNFKVAGEHPPAIHTHKRIGFFLVFQIHQKPLAIDTQQFTLTSGSQWTAPEVPKQARNLPKTSWKWQAGTVNDN
jgi:hypothetical protein